MSRVLLVLCFALVSISSAQAYNCYKHIVRTQAEEKSFCHIHVYWTDNSPWETAFRKTVSSAYAPEAQTNCAQAEAEATAKCEDYRKYDQQLRGRCYLKHYECKNYLAE